MADRKTAPRLGWPWRPVRRQGATRWRPGRVGALRANSADRHVAARGPTKTSQTSQTSRSRHRLVGLRRHIFDEMSSLTIYLVLHPKKPSIGKSWVVCYFQRPPRSFGLRSRQYGAPPPLMPPRPHRTAQSRADPGPSFPAWPRAALTATKGATSVANRLGGRARGHRGGSRSKLAATRAQTIRTTPAPRLPAVHEPPSRVWPLTPSPRQARASC